MSFQMAVENNYAITIATLSYWLKSLVPVFQQMRGKTETNHNCTREFSPGFWASYRYDLLGILIGLSRLPGNVVIGRINNFGIGFSFFIWKLLW